MSVPGKGNRAHGMHNGIRTSHLVASMRTTAASVAINRHPPDSRTAWMIFHPIEARCNKIQLATDCNGSQIAELAIWKRWNSLSVLHQGTHLPSSSGCVPSRWLFMLARAARAAERSTTGSRRTSVVAPRPRLAET